MIEIPLAQFKDHRKSVIPWEQIPLNPSAIIAGGCVRRLFLGMKQDSDIDLFFRSKADYESNIDLVSAAGFSVTGNDKVKTCVRGTLKVQLIAMDFYESVKKLLDSFDFTVCQFAVENDKMFATESAIVDAARRTLAVHKVTYPIATMRRFYKYQQQGFVPCTGSYKRFVELVRAIENPDLTTPYVD